MGERKREKEGGGARPQRQRRLGPTLKNPAVPPLPSLTPAPPPTAFPQLCKPCFYAALEDEVHTTITTANLFSPGEVVAVAASGGKDSTVLAHLLSLLNARHAYGLDLRLLSIDEGIAGYRDDSLATVKRNEAQYGVPLTILSYADLYDGWTMDSIVKEIGHRGNCTFCGVFRRQALDRGAALLKADKVATGELTGEGEREKEEGCAARGAVVLLSLLPPTKKKKTPPHFPFPGHNADDIAETVLLNLVRGDAPRLARTASPITGAGGPLPRVKPLAATYEKEIVLYAHFKKLDYFSTECVYSPFAARGATRDAVKALEAVRPTAIAGLVRAAQTLVPRGGGGGGGEEGEGRVGEAAAVLPAAPGGRRRGGRAGGAPLEATQPKACALCGYMTSQPVCKACELLGTLNERRRRKAEEARGRVEIAFE